jgi:hypothetical protein
MFQLQPMSKHQRQWRAGDTSWLSMLVDRFEKTCQSDLGAVPCDEPVLLALKSHLARPALPQGGRGTDFPVLN